MDDDRNTDAPPDRPDAAGGAQSSKPPRRPKKPRRKPGRKTRSNKQYDEVVDFVVLLMNRRQTKAFIKKAVNNQFFRPEAQSGSWAPGCGWGVTPRTIEDYIARARERIVKDSKKTPAQHKNEAIAFYNSVVSGPDAEMGERLRAQERIDKLVGSEAPTEHHVAGKDGGPLTVAITEIVIEHHTPGPDDPTAADPSAEQGPADAGRERTIDSPVPPGPDAGLELH